MKESDPQKISIDIFPVHYILQVSPLNCTQSR
jgi:hypothetical protein